LTGHQVDINPMLNSGSETVRTKDGDTEDTSTEAANKLRLEVNFTVHLIPASSPNLVSASLLAISLGLFAPGMSSLATWSVVQDLSPARI
jgi:hypothetical protein